MKHWIPTLVALIEGKSLDPEASNLRSLVIYLKTLSNPLQEIK